MLSTVFKFGEVNVLAEQVKQDDVKVAFRQVFENANGGVALLAFKAGQSLAKHLAPAEVMVYALEGEIEFTMIDRVHTLHAGEFLLMGEGVPHSVRALADAKMMLLKVKSDK